MAESTAQATASAATTGDKHPNLAAIERFFAAYAAKDVGAVREVLAPDIVWHIPGHHPLSGPKHGVDEVLAFFDQLGQADMKAQPYAQAVSGDYVLDFHRGWSEAGAGMDTTWCLAFRFEAGRLKEVTNLRADQHAADMFFWSVYRLKPIPERLA
jgi:hypothetical protein